jgi:hypothetical protein
VDIFKILSLEPGTRMINGKVYLDETYQTYCKLIENSNIVSAEMKNMIEPSRHLQFSPKLLSSTKEEVAAEIHSIPSLSSSKHLLNSKRSSSNDEKDEPPQNNRLLYYFDEEEEKPLEHKQIMVLPLEHKQIMVLPLEHKQIMVLPLEEEKETIRIIEMEENNKVLHLGEEEEEKEQITDEIIISAPAVEETLANELITKVKRKYTKKTAL